MKINSIEQQRQKNFINKCGIDRKTFDGKQNFGTITNFENNTHFCEWLITTGSSIHYINLKFVWINLTCNADTIYIFDGDSFEDKLIASINGPFTSINPVFGSSGSLLILYYFENQFSGTFSIDFYISECPLNCSGRGVCQNNRCLCDKFRNGDACQFELCPNDCSKYGNCVPALVNNDSCATVTEYFCDCQPNFVGQSCNIQLEEKQSGWKIFFANEQLFPARASHASVYDPISDKIYIYGGRNYEVVFSDLLSYSFKINKWFNLTNCDINTSIFRPKSLWGHTLNIINDSLLLFGGISEDGIFSNELWIYNLTENRWNQKEFNGFLKIPGLAFHISIIADLKWLYVHGGQLQDSTYSANIYRINILDYLSQWQLIIPVNSKPYFRQIAAHTALFYNRLRSIIFFGGISMIDGRLSKLRNEFHLYNIDKNIWSTLNQSQHDYIPSKRAFHSMILVNDYLLIFGGFTEHRFNGSIECRDSKIYIYSLISHHFINLENFNVAFPFDSLFSHSLIRRDDLLFIIGGYFDNVRNEILVFNLPNILFNSSYNVIYQNLCPRLNSCFDCLSYENIDSCLWNVQKQSCIRNTMNNNSFNNEHYITQKLNCKNYNAIYSGVTLLKYYNTPNFSNPDEVSIMSQTKFETSFQEEWLKKNCDIQQGKCLFQKCHQYKNGSFNMARILGFVHPLGTQSYHNNIVRIYLRSTSSDILFSSPNNSNPLVMKSIASIKSIYNSYIDVPFDFSNNFFIDFIIKFPIRTVMDKFEYEKIDITWETVFNSTANDLILKPFSDENLCPLQLTCSSCLSNLACAWCSSTNQCMIRSSNVSLCQQSSITIEPKECFYCFEAIYCGQCAQNPNCEWLPRYSVCVRRGRFNNSIRSIQSCPIECYKRESLETCLDGSNDCMWCKSTNRCLHFSNYYPSSLFSYCHQYQNLIQPINCTECPIGSFGNATIGCFPCQCNGHGDLSRGICHRETGVCFCQDFTEGIHCDRCISGYYGDPKNHGHCFLECQNKALINNATFGYFGSYIRDIHFSKYYYSRNNSLSTSTNIHCLWIFTAENNYLQTSNSKSIHITIFRTMNLNCSYNTLIIYDGIPNLITMISNSTEHRENILASLCNWNKAQDIKLIAYSGVATVLYISNNLDQGFNGTYQAINNPTNHSMPFNSSIEWPQNSHTLEYYSDHLIFIGGHFHDKHLSLTLFSLKYRRWIVPKQKQKTESPSNKNFHATCLIDNKLYVYGGMDLRSNQVTNEFWSAFINPYNSTNFVWINLSNLSHSMPPLVGHTLTNIKFKQRNAIILIGGFSPHEGFFPDHFIFIIDTNQWQRISTKGPAPIGIVTHSTIYHLKTNTIYVFGGIDFKESHKMAISNTLYTLNLTTQVWHRIQASVRNSISPLYLHKAGSFKNYMLIFGGKKQYNINETESTSVFAYFYKCNQWISMNNIPFLKNLLLNRKFHSKKSSSLIQNNSIYLYETSFKFWTINTVNLPSDFCNFYSNNRSQCLNINGCSFCISSTNSSGSCYDNNEEELQDCVQDSISPGKKCSLINDCSQFKNCADCTTNNYELKNDDGCQWCTDCHLINGQCIKMNDTCQSDEDLNNDSYSYSETFCSNISLVETNHCLSRRCLATDCHKCLLLNQNNRQNECIWTKQVYKFIRFGHAIPTNPIFDWACIESSIIKFTGMKNVPTIPPLECPSRCHKHQTCSSCLEETTGDESGSHECIWSELTHECLSPTYTLLKCQNGLCGGFIYRRMQSQCPRECETFDKATDCLSMLHCGWCAIDDLPIDGIGFCLKGGLFGPIHKNCSNQSTELLSELNHKFYYTPTGNFKTQWYYLYPPKENECLNGHHTCDEVSQDCIDLAEGFMCRCKKGYKMFEKSCKPICQQGCTHGICIAPNICSCHFGFIGEDCSVECQCHGHSTCPSTDRPNECIECHNNTQGKLCEQCKPFFVGNPKTLSSCQPCIQYCHNHSKLCFSEEHLTNTSLEVTMFSDDYWYEFGLKIKRGSSEKTICVNCKNNTEGERCDRCKLGFFKISDDIRDGCRRCMCNGHGYLCNPFNGENCNCHNNTENDRQCNYLNSKEYSNYINKTYFFKSSQIMTTYSLPCWMLQCSKCKDYFYGIPTNGHQCYRHMYIDKEYCLDPETQENCLHRPQPLLHGRTTFFGIQPRYMNVDIKLIVYSIEGQIDLYLASKDDMFVVKVDPDDGFHHVFIDKKYIQLDLNISKVRNNDMLELEDPIVWPLRSPYKLIIQNLNAQISSYYTMKNWYELVVLQNIRSRLEITIPYKNHDLRTTRYYLMIRGNYLFDSDINHGFIVLRQDQSRIDLFIFFCVFLACFFVFLCFSIMFWRLKQTIDLHRARHQQEIELEHMANRPFVKITILLDEEPPVFQKVLCHSLQGTPSKKVFFLRQLAIGFKESPKIYPENQIMKTYGEKNIYKTPMPISIEPTHDGLAAIFTTLIKLPSTSSSSIRMAAASSLIFIKNCPLISQKLNQSK